jgi:hypothetical protein
MSCKNGDKSRYNRQRNENIHKRALNRRLRKALQERNAGADSSRRISKSVA